MKKACMVLLLVLIGSWVYADESEYYVNDIKDEFWGIYIPEDFKINYEKSFNYSLSYKSSSAKKAHDVLIVEKNKIWSDAGFHDGYAIPAKEARRYQYSTVGQDQYITDEKQNRYYRLGAGDRERIDFIVGAYLMDKMGNAFNRISRDLAISTMMDKLYFTWQLPRLGPYSVLLDTTLFDMHGFDSTKYSLFLYRPETSELLGLIVSKDVLMVDQILETHEFEGNITAKSEIKTINLYKLK